MYETEKVRKVYVYLNYVQLIGPEQERSHKLRLEINTEFSYNLYDSPESS